MTFLSAILYAVFSASAHPYPTWLQDIQETPQEARHMPSVEVIGVYAVKSSTPVYLIEVRVHDSPGIFDAGEFTQEDPTQPQSNWQVAYMECILNPEGTKVLADDFVAPSRPELWKGTVRMTFFLHYLNLRKPLRTPVGEVLLPKVSKRPARLNSINYESPD